MELILSVAAFASFVALIAAWATTPRTRVISAGASEPAPSTRAAHVIAAN
ncbi:MAG TPA: hypothetical protein VK898_04415 [Chloroflexota bacterium]|jgi:hypothetical protein|nr:hypothetical protein [Chloroflexota bacterium]